MMSTLEKMRRRRHEALDRARRDVREKGYVYSSDAEILIPDLIPPQERSGGGEEGEAACRKDMRS